MGNFDDEIVRGTEAEAFDIHLQSMEKNARFRGSVMVVKKGEVLLSKGYGLATPTLKNTPSTIFQIASLTKQFTAAAVLELCRMGKVDLDAPIPAYIAGKYQLELGTLDLWKPIKVRHLLSHTSGIPNYTDSEDYFEKSKRLTLEGILHWAKNQDLNFKPGKEFEYSNTGYILLGVIIEKQSGLSYGEFVKQKLLIPSRMYSSGVYEGTSQPHAAVGYCLDKKGENLAEDHSENISATFSDGAMYSTVQDMAKWAQVLDGHNEILGKETIDRMTTPGMGGYGYGLEIDTIFGKKIVHHSGSIAGFKTDFCKYPEEEIVLVVLCNNIDFAAEHISSEISKYLFGKQKKITVAVPFPKDFDYTPYLGFFDAKEDEENSAEFFLKRSGQLFMDGTPPTQCILLSNQRLFNPSLGCEYGLNNNDTLTLYDCDGNPMDTLMHDNE